MATIQSRKSDHIAIAVSGQANHEKTSLLEDVELRHASLPECRWEDIDISCILSGFKVRAPLFIAGMTGGTEEARDINRSLAKAAERFGIPMGLGSQRAMLEDTALLSTFDIKEFMPNSPLFGNLGIVQAKTYGLDKIIEMAKTTQLDGLCIHLNPAQEMAQIDGDRDFVGCQSFLKELAHALPIPLIAKETGAGMELATLEQLRQAGINHVDISGAGGTSWTAVESFRKSTNKSFNDIGKEYWNWGCPTAVSIVAAASKGFEVIASGGIRSGLDIAKSIALGATAAGMAQPLLKALKDHGEEGLFQTIESLLRSLKTACLLTGSNDLETLRQSSPIIGIHLAHQLKERGLGPQ